MKAQTKGDKKGGERFCKDCLKASIRIDEDGAEYHNKGAYEESFEKHHPRIEQHQP